MRRYKGAVTSAISLCFESHEYALQCNLIYGVIRIKQMQLFASALRELCMKFITLNESSNISDEMLITRVVVIYNVFDKITL